VKLSFSEITSIIQVARDNPKVEAMDIIESFIDRHRTNEDVIVTNQGKPDEHVSVRPPLHRIMQVVCSVHCITDSLMMSKNRQREIVRARQQYCFIGVLFNYTQESISDEINKDHTNVLHHKNKALTFYQLELDYKAEIDSIISEFSEYGELLNSRITNMINNIKPKQSARNKHKTNMNHFKARVIRKCTDLTKKELTELFNVSATSIHNIRKGISWKQINEK